jgi:dTDP-glucose 4,6-dehydratase
VVRLGSLTPRRDLTYVKDTVSGFVAIAGCAAALGRVVNIGRGEDLTIGELVERIGRRLGRAIAVETEPARLRPEASEVGRLLAGTRLAQDLFGWAPQYTLDRALDETIAWVRENRALFRVDEYAT